MEVAGVDDNQIALVSLILRCLDNRGKLSPDQIENFHIFVPVRRKNKSGRILQLKTDVQQIGFVYCFVKAGFHKYLQDVIEIYVNYNQKR